ncbi:hypothetical protein BV25DRAFT_1581568 [Artomyces pyxidatus]|uniref:Uncharacterized protein n=1 Tax=Artomyces pyxidatus TaxID=48021 RepID=A0ACB8TBH8_9AGAM|nr:hypothetical protein BV25DRAFT_1581568 [Artomyces pyxidatus]
MDWTTGTCHTPRARPDLFDHVRLLALSWTPQELHRLIRGDKNLIRYPAGCDSRSLHQVSPECCTNDGETRLSTDSSTAGGQIERRHVGTVRRGNLPRRLWRRVDNAVGDRRARLTPEQKQTRQKKWSTIMDSHKSPRPTSSSLYRPTQDTQDTTVSEWRGGAPRACASCRRPPR